MPDVRKSGRVARAVGLSIALVVASAGCEGDDELIGSGRGAQADGDDRPCPAFVPGTNMLQAAWASDALENAEAAAFAQGVGDIAATSDAVLATLTRACLDLVVATGTALEGPSPGETPTASDAERACASAREGLVELVSSLGGTLEVELTTRASCDVATGLATCDEACGVDATCDDFCATAVLWYAPCSPAILDITVVPEGDPALLAALPAVEAALGAVAGAQERLAWLMVGTPALPDDTSITPACVDVLIASLEESVSAIETSTVAGDALFAAVGR